MYQKGVSGTSDDRKLVSTSSFDLLVRHPAEAAERIRSLTERVGGFLVKSQTNGAQDATSALIVVRVPAARFAEVAAEIRKRRIAQMRPYRDLMGFAIETPYDETFITQKREALRQHGISLLTIQVEPDEMTIH